MFASMSRSVLRLMFVCVDFVLLFSLESFSGTLLSVVLLCCCFNCGLWETNPIFYFLSSAVHLNSNSHFRIFTFKWGNSFICPPEIQLFMCTQPLWLFFGLVFFACVNEGRCKCVTLCRKTSIWLYTPHTSRAPAGPLPAHKTWMTACVLLLLLFIYLFIEPFPNFFLSLISLFPSPSLSLSSPPLDPIVYFSSLIGGRSDRRSAHEEQKRPSDSNILTAEPRCCSLTAPEVEGRRPLLRQAW